MANSSINELTTKIDNLSQNLCERLILKLDNKFEFLERNFYAKSFLIAALFRVDKTKYAKTIDGLIKTISSEIKDKTYHYEFNRYALIDAFGSKKAIGIVGTKKFTYGKVANWSLLRTFCRIKEAGNSNLLALAELARVKILFCTPHGIEDSRNYFSSQYNIFSLVLLNETRNISKFFFSDKWMNNAINNCIAQTSSQGVTNLIGRGSLQTFGYAAYIYLLSFYTKDKNVNKILNDLLSILHIEFKKNTETPLVLFKNEKFQEKKYVGEPDLKSLDKLGWYSYNNAPDYSAFTSLMLLKAKENIKNDSLNLTLTKPKNKKFYEFANQKFSYQDSNILVLFGIQSKKSNECALFNPIIVKGMNFILPPLGGEQSKISNNNDTDFGFPLILDYNLDKVKIKSSKIFNVRNNSIEQEINFEKNLFLKRRIIMCQSKIIILDFIINNTNKAFSYSSLRLTKEKNVNINFKLKSNLFTNKLFKISEKENDIYSTNNLCDSYSVRSLLSPKEKLIFRGAIIL